MNNKMFNVLIVCGLALILSCSSNNDTVEITEAKAECGSADEVQKEPHRYGGWYCPDNLNGFPAVDLKNWMNVPVVNDRMATKEETQNGTSLIFVDTEKYPNAKPLDMEMPKLATYDSRITGRNELIIVIQALNIDNDSIVGFRYLNGGNGSARLDEVQLLHDNEIQLMRASHFVSIDKDINATDETVWKVLTKAEHAEALLPAFNVGNQLDIDWRNETNMNYAYADAGPSTASYAEKLFGNFYIQNDYKKLNYSEKFLLLRNDETESTTLKIVCGPYDDDFEAQKAILSEWANKLKSLSEEG